MEADPGQDHDIATEQPDVAAQLRQAVAAVGEGGAAAVGDGRPAIPGRLLASSTLLPARDGVPDGGIERSAKRAQLLVLHQLDQHRRPHDLGHRGGQAGKYEAVVYYTCPPADIGSTVELSFLDGRVRRKVTEANDPPLVGAEGRPRAARASRT